MKLSFVKFFGLLLIPLLCSVGNAADLTIFGLSLGKKFDVPECRKISTTDTAVYESSTDRVCFQRGRVKESSPLVNDDQNLQTDQIFLKFPAFGKPQIVAGERISAVVVNKKLEGIIFDTEGAATSDLVMEQLNAKYNSPTSVTPIQIQKGQNKVNAFKAEWRLPELFVAFQNINFSGGKGMVFILTEKGNSWYSEQMKRLVIIV